MTERKETTPLEKLLLGLSASFMLMAISLWKVLGGVLLFWAAWNLVHGQRRKSVGFPVLVVAATGLVGMSLIMNVWIDSFPQGRMLEYYLAWDEHEMRFPQFFFLDLLINGLVVFIAGMLTFGHSKPDGVDVPDGTEST